MTDIERRLKALERARERAEAAAEYKTVHDTETIKIDVVKGVIIEEDKTAGITYTIERKAAKYGK